MIVSFQNLAASVRGVVEGLPGFSRFEVRESACQPVSVNAVEQEVGRVR